jgi:hypothetical protein
MASIAEERTAVDQLTSQLRDAAAASARGLQALRGTPAGDALDRQLEHTLDRLALLYGHGVYEALSTPEIVETAVENEQRLAAALNEPDAAAAAGRARALIDAARRGVRLHVREPADSVRLYRGVYVAPLRTEVEQALWAEEAGYLRWGDGAVLILNEDELAEIRAAGDDAKVLFLDADELLDMDFSGDRPALEAELERRRTVAQAAPDGVGDSPDSYVLRLLHGQNIVLRNLRDRLAGDHPSAHESLLPIVADERTLFERRLAAQPASAGAGQDPLGGAIEAERAVQDHLGRWAVEPDDPAGLRDRFKVVADAGTHLTDLEQQR